MCVQHGYETLPTTFTFSKHDGWSNPDSQLRKGILGWGCDLWMEQIGSFPRFVLILIKHFKEEIFQKSFALRQCFSCKSNRISKVSVIHYGIPHTLSSCLLVFSLCPCLPPPLSVILTSSSQNCSLADSSLALPLGSCQHSLIKS